jgi:hypothetical protein
LATPDETESGQQSPTSEPKRGADEVDPVPLLDLLREQPSPGTTFQRLKDAACDYSPVAILSQLTNRFLFVRRDEFHDESSEIHRHHAYIEFLTGLLASQPFPSGELKELTASGCDEIWQRLQDYFDSVQRDLLASGIEKTDLAHELQFDAKHHSLMVRGEAYPHQLESMVLGLYSEHDAWFQRNFGFTVKEALLAVDRIFRLAAWRRGEVLSKLEGDRGDENRRTEVLTQYAEAIIGFTVDELATVSELPLATCASLLKRLSLDFGYRNSRHPETFTDPREAPWDFNTLYEKPFVHHGGRYYLFVPPLVRTALFKTFWFDLQADESYCETFKAAQGRWLEREVAERLRIVFGRDAIVLNPRKANKNRDELSDVLVLYDRNILIVQCKSKSLRHEAKTGDFDALISDVRKAVVNAFSQGLAARDYLFASEESVIVLENGEAGIVRDLVTSVYLLTVTPVPLQFLTTRLANNESVRDLFPGDEFPWALSLPDLDTLSDVLRTPERFLHYARRRMEIERAPFSLHGDEMDLLGLYIAGHLRTDSPQFEGYDAVGIAGLSGDIDEYVWKKHEGGLEVDPPEPPISPEFAELIRNVMASGCLGATDCAITLLDHSGNARKQLLDGIAEAKNRARQTGKMQRFTAMMAGGELGVSFLALDSSEDPGNLARQLECYAIVQKYAERCPTWVALASDVGSSRIVDLCMFLSGPWREDAGLEQLADRFIPTRARKGSSS